MFKQMRGSCDNLTVIVMEDLTFSDCSLKPPPQTFPPFHSLSCTHDVWGYFLQTRSCLSLSASAAKKEETNLFIIMKRTF